MCTFASKGRGKNSSARGLASTAKGRGCHVCGYTLPGRSKVTRWQGRLFSLDSSWDELADAQDREDGSILSPLSIEGTVNGVSLEQREVREMPYMPEDKRV